jgi:hypothetical protein
MDGESPRRNQASDANPIDQEAVVLQRYGGAAAKFEACLCSTVSYDTSLLEVIPKEIVGKDYGRQGSA